MNFIRLHLRSIAILPVLLASCDPKPDPQTLRSFLGELVASCPMSAADDEAARDACADRLADSTLLAELMSDPISWGGYPAIGDESYRPEDRSLTSFDPLVFRRIYLSTFMFGSGSSSLETQGLTIVRVPALFRNRLSAGSYPYPFWHEKEKWDAYQGAIEILFVFRGREIVAAYRSGDDRARKTEDRGTFDGQWRWFDEAGGEEPHVALFTYLLSPDNPHLAALDSAYRAFENGARMNACETCHAPSNVAKMNPLVILNLPNQALAARHELLDVFRSNSMPPGIGLDDETRDSLAELAESFARIGDRALEHEAKY